ncbi:MAG: TetR/AcrR family transcriptional regulator [Leptospiraceae bacterium]|nr:TetR/AcrR family transcriptional regulator [Leptospiraceae bacterium]MCP5512199.1 TetR/AcrR family transcriptional regulator [Leptospiraceae bacterium]
METLESADLKKEKMLEAAEDLFSKNGFSATGIQEISKLAGIGTGTFYKYFPEKELLLRELMSRLFSHLRKELKELRIGIEYQSPLEQLLTIKKTFEIALRSLVKKSRLTMIYMRTSRGLNPEVDDLISKFEADFVKDIVEDLERAERAGLILLSEKELFGYGMIGMVKEIAYKMISEEREDIEKAVNLCAKFTILGIVGYCPPEKIEQFLPALRLLFG